MSGLNEEQDRHYETMNNHRIIMVKLDWRLDWWLCCCLSCAVVIIDSMTYDTSLELVQAHSGLCDRPSWAPEGAR